MNQFEVVTIRARVETISIMGPTMLRKYFQSINWMYGDITILRIERIADDDTRGTGQGQETLASTETIEKKLC